ncbi:bacterial extracellular solute-binding family protein [Paraburkholderia xenovorans LB400]|uniref:Carbohydrate ABC transporter substrate-binding protein, CUT1 family n=1 Tax=Paraburkholderia xenovorans (strain LB400) TaxID=266265 RepID=Q13J91_PARXL|nr:extracellular solute-binding protein [Paraburkholderia xenovorans]ABE35848.1 carbohydrate ABC transporter substrate-binding protein, CUT1 family [Paraburkholderia xenovorans LB400]AIP36845.1 bacterial extracellular solute-binding family protein [Paraburkholderia xenovorans LB400]
MSEMAKFGSRRRFLQLSVGAGLAATELLRGLPQAFAADAVNFYAWSAGVDTVRRQIAAFTAKTGVPVNYNNLPFAQYREAMVTKFVGAAPVDALWVSDGWLPEWADAGWIAPIDGFPELIKYNSDVQDFCVQSMRYKDRQYGMTYYTDYMAFLYDADMLAKAGIPAPPESWDELVAQSLKIKQAGLSTYPLMLPMARESWLIEFMSSLVFSHGGRFVDDNNRVVMDDPKHGAVTSLQWVVDAVNKHHIVSPACVESGELNGFKAVASGNHAFALLPRYRIQALNDPRQSHVAGRIKQALMPAGPNGSHATVAWMRMHAMSAATAANKTRAASAGRLIEAFGGKFDGQYAFQKAVFLDTGTAFGVKSLFRDPEIKAAYEKYGDFAMFQQQQNLARKKDVITRWFGDWDETNSTAWQSAILGQASAADALKASASKWTGLGKQV